jgi:VanZ family protein
MTSALLQSAVKPAFWLACIAVATLSLLPVNELPSMVMNLWDKAQHAMGFFGLGLLGIQAYRQRLLKVCIGLLLFGAAIEVAQALSGWRTGDPLDWLADATGIVMAALSMILLKREAD